MNLPLHSRFLLFTCEALRFAHAHTGIYSIFFTIRMKINFQSAVLYYSTKQRTIVHKYFWGLFTARNYQITAILVITFFFSCYDSHLGLILAARNAGTTWLQFCRGAEGTEVTDCKHKQLRANITNPGIFVFITKGKNYISYTEYLWCTCKHTHGCRKMRKITV